MLSELVLVAAILLSAADAQPAPFHVIVHPSAKASSVRRAELSAIFMRRTKSWPDGVEVHPVEPSSKDLRGVFARTVHGKSLAYVTRYWHRVIFAGRGVPPEELPSDREVVEYVKTHRGAIGYIGTVPGNDVKVLTVAP